MIDLRVSDREAMVILLVWTSLIGLYVLTRDWLMRRPYGELKGAKSSSAIDGLFSPKLMLLLFILVFPFSAMATVGAFWSDHDGAYWIAGWTLVMSLIPFQSRCLAKRDLNRLGRAAFRDQLMQSLHSFAQRMKSVKDRMQSGDPSAVEEFLRDYDTAPLERVYSGDPTAVIEFMEDHAGVILTPLQRRFAYDALRTTR